jgi:hypothetical protein
MPKIEPRYPVLLQVKVGHEMAADLDHARVSTGMMLAEIIRQCIRIGLPRLRAKLEVKR